VTVVSIILPVVDEKCAIGINVIRTCRTAFYKGQRPKKKDRFGVFWQLRFYRSCKCLEAVRTLIPSHSGTTSQALIPLFSISPETIK
jgi:hypothetical protein